MGMPAAHEETPLTEKGFRLKFLLNFV